MKKLSVFKYPVFHFSDKWEELGFGTRVPGFEVPSFLSAMQGSPKTDTLEPTLSSSTPLTSALV